MARARRADPQVTNLGQARRRSKWPSRRSTVVAAASCAYPFTIANESACPPGPGRRWSVELGAPIEDVAGGDTLRFEFSRRMAGERRLDVQLRAGPARPGRQRDPNYDVTPSRRRRDRRSRGLAGHPAAARRGRRRVHVLVAHRTNGSRLSVRDALPVITDDVGRDARMAYLPYPGPVIPERSRHRNYGGQDA